jgi:hypothetical protein
MPRSAQSAGTRLHGEASLADLLVPTSLGVGAATLYGGQGNCDRGFSPGIPVLARTMLGASFDAEALTGAEPSPATRASRSNPRETLMFDTSRAHGRIPTFLLCASCAVLGAGGCADETAAPPPAYPPPPSAAPPTGPEAEEVEPPTPPPATAPEPTQPPPSPPPAPPSPAEVGQGVMAPPMQSMSPPAPVAAAPPVAPVPASPSPGQWVYTNQYGWIWMPYSRDYTYVAPDGGMAYEYAYYPSAGWRWIYAPWILGWGPSPFWGRLGPVRFSWYAHPWFRVGFVHRGVGFGRWHRR